MKTLNSIFGKNDLSDVFNSFIGHGLTEMEMNYIRGGGDPVPDPHQDPLDIIIPIP